MTSAADDPPRAAPGRPRARSSPTTARVYAPEYGVDSTLRGARRGAASPRAGKRGWPGDRRGRLDRRARRRATPAASRSPTRATARAALRWFVLDPEPARPRPRPPAGRRAARARRSAHGYERIGLETFSELRAAAHIYRSHGFELHLGRDRRRAGAATQLTYQRYELSFQRSRPVRELARAPARAPRPFSVSA